MLFTVNITAKDFITDRQFEYNDVQYLVLPLDSIDDGEFEYRGIKYTITPYKELDWIELDKDVTLKGVI